MNDQQFSEINEFFKMFGHVIDRNIINKYNNISEDNMDSTSHVDFNKETYIIDADFEIVNTNKRAGYSNETNPIVE